jgi:hypothetical protein
MANTPRSRKNKGKRLQNQLRDVLLEISSPTLESDDIRSTIMGESGTDLKLSPAAKKVFPYSFECKNQEKLNIWDALKQAEENVQPNTVPALVFTRNHTPTYVTISLEHFLELIKPKPTVD